MSKQLLRLCNGLLTTTVSLVLVAAMFFAGYALWDNSQISASADQAASDMQQLRNQALANAGDISGEPVAAPVSDTGATEAPADETAAPDEASDLSEPDEEMTTEALPDPQITAEPTVEPTEEPETPLMAMFRQLWGVNPDIGAWVTIPDTTIDYPVVQGITNFSYLSTNIYGNFDIVGSIFLDSRNSPNYADRYNLLYGHNMSEHRMFSDINLFKEETFFNEHQTGTLYLPTGSHKLQSLSIILTNANDSSIFNPTPWYEYDDEKALEVIQKNALFLSEEGMEALQAKIDAGEPVQILALSTCSNEFTDARTILLTLMDP